MHKPKYVKKNSDSQAALLALKSNTFTSTTAISPAEAVSNLAWIAKKVTLAWARAHVHTQGNGMADKAAKQAANEDSIIDTPLPPTHRKT